MPEQTLDAAHHLLKQFDCVKGNPAVTPEEKPALQQALRQVVEASDYQIFGVCADSLEHAITALKTYAQALGYEIPKAIDPIAGPAYLKFNPRTALCYTSTYEGDHRGVLVSCQSDYADRLNEMYGHLPLDLFD